MFDPTSQIIGHVTKIFYFVNWESAHTMSTGDPSVQILLISRAFHYLTNTFDDLNVLSILDVSSGFLCVPVPVGWCVDFDKLI